MKNRYYGSHTVVGGPIRKLDAVGFKDLVDNYFSVPVPMRHTREDFGNLPDTARKKEKDGPYVTACTFKEGETHRCDDNAEFVVLAILDIDDPKDAESFFRFPETIGDALSPYNFVAYTTASHTDAKPRLKIIVDVKSSPLNTHGKCVRHVVDLLGMSRSFKGVRESTVISQPQYRPVKYLNEDYVALIGRRTSGEALDPGDFGDVVDEETSSDEDRRYAHKGDTTTGLEDWPLGGVQVEDIREALFAISPDVGYEQWTHIACALRHQFRTEADSKAAYLIFDEWSSLGAKYGGEKETYAKWKSFRPDPKGKSPIKIGSLFRLAVDSGWDFRKIAESTKKSILEWIKACEDEDELLETGCRRISELPFTNRLVEERLMETLRSRAKKLSGVSLSKAVVTKQLSDEKFVKKAENQGSEPPTWMSPWCYITTENKFCNAATGSKLVPEAFNNTFSENLMPTDLESELAKTGRPSILPVHQALNVVKIPKVDGSIYDPRHEGMEPYIEYEGRKFLNEYRISTTPVEDDTTSEEAGLLFLAHMELLIEEREYRELLIDYICWSIQNPGQKIRWMTVIQSGQGAGKGILKAIIAAVIGEPNLKVVSAAMLTSQWNDWMVGAQFSILEEVHTPGQSREVVANNLKQFISDDILPINKRNVSAFTHPNYGNALAFSNYFDAFHMKDDDRRYLIIESALQTKEQIRAVVDSGHYKRVERLFKGPKNLAGGLRHWMKNKKVSDSFPVNGPAPSTHYRRAVVEAGKNRLQNRIEILLAMDSEPLISSDVIHYGRLESMTQEDAFRNHSINHFLKVLGYEEYQEGASFDVDGTSTKIWTHRGNYLDGADEPAELLLASRVRDLVK